MSTICLVNKIDSNISGLSYAEEACLKVLPSLGAGDPSDPVWYGLEPNSYSGLGGALTTVARQPISATRQRKKGTVTGLQATAAFNTDFTQTNLVRLMQGFFFNDAAQKPTTVPITGPAAVALSNVANSDSSFNVAANMPAFLPSHIVNAKNFASAANNGRHYVVSTTGTKLVVAEALVNDAAPAANALLHAVGYKFASGAVAIAASGTAVTLTIAGLASAVGTLTTTGNFAAADTVTVGSVTYTFRTVLAAPNDVLIGASATASLVNLAAAINGSTGAGTLYGTGTVANPAATATSGSTTLAATASVSGTAGNAVATTKTGTGSSWGAATLAGGTGATGWLGLKLQVGEFIFVGGDAANTTFTQVSSTNRPGYARIASITDSVLTFDDLTWTAQTDSGTGKTIEVYFGTVIKNGGKTRSYQFERTLGLDGTGLTQSQYITGAVPNDLTINMPNESKVTADLKFIGLNEELRTGTDGLKAGARVPSAGESAINTSTDIYRVRMHVVDPTNIGNQALFGFVSAATLTLANNVSDAKALGFVGGFDVNVGNFDVGGSITAYFSDVAALKAARANADVGLNYILAQGNAGVVFDIPLMGVSVAGLNIALSTAIEIPVTTAAAQNKNGYTLMGIWFSYLPTVAMPS